jgi:hypothetical protein
MTLQLSTMYNLFNGSVVHEMSFSPLKSLGGNVSKAEMF